MSIKTPSAVDSPYITVDTAPTRLASAPVAGGGVDTVAATVDNIVSADANANANTASASTGSNVSYYTSGIEGVAGLANYGRVFAGANVYVTLEQPQYITYNQNYTGSGTVGGANGQVQFNNNGVFGGSANLIFDGSTLSAGSINTGNLSAVGVTAGNVSTPIVYNNGMAMQGYDYVQMQYSNAVALPVSPYDLGTGSLFYLDSGGATFQSNTTGNITQIVLGNDGSFSAQGNITGNYFIGNGSQLTGISVGSSNKIFNGNSYANIANANGNVVIGANGNAWTFGTDGTTTFPNSTINPGNNQPLTIRTTSNGNAYTVAYQSSNSWEAYAEDDNTEANPAYAWIRADLATANTPRVFINNVRGGDGLSSTWTFNADGSFTPPTQPSNQRTGSGLVLKIGDENTQAIITGPAPVANTYNAAPRLVVAGQDGVINGEGGDIYLWAGRSGPDGGTGGDIKVDGGLGLNGSEGGTIKVRSGNSVGGTGGFIEILGGHGDFGGPVTITSGYGNSQANSANVTIQTTYGGTWVFDNYGNLTLPGNTTISALSGNLKINPVRSSTLNNYSQDTGNVLYYNTTTHEVTTAPANNITGDPYAAAISDSTGNATVWTASSDEVVGAKLTVRVVYYSTNTNNWQNTEMLDITAAKTWPDGAPAFTVSNRIKTNNAYSSVLIDVTLATGNVMQVISSAPDGAGNNVYWTCSATSFNQTFD